MKTRSKLVAVTLLAIFALETAGCSALLARRPPPPPAPPPLEADCRFVRTLMLGDFGLAALSTAAGVAAGIRALHKGLTQADGPSPSWQPESHRLTAPQWAVAGGLLFLTAAALTISGGAAGAPKLRACRSAQAGAHAGPATALPSLTLSRTR